MNSKTVFWVCAAAVLFVAVICAPIMAIQYKNLAKAESEKMSNKLKYSVEIREATKECLNAQDKSDDDVVEECSDYALGLYNAK